jgi:spore coat protein U-like protein
MYTATKVTILALALVAAGVATAQAQNSAPMNVTATVFRPITVAADRNLVFGNVFPGQGAQGMALASPSAGHFTITGEPSASVSMAFVVSPLSQGANTLPLSLSGTYNTLDNTAGSSLGSFASPTAASLSGGALGQLFVYVIGTVTPAANQAPGNYTGTVQLTVIYQ